MSERPHGIEPAQPVQPRESAVGILVRRSPAGRLEVLVGRRSRRSRFMGGHWAFLGGALEAVDEPDRPGAHARCVAREMAEETGFEVPAERWLPAGLLVTPPMFRVRYRTEFFIAEVGSEREAPSPPPRPEEIDALRFVDPETLLREWEAGQVEVPPILPVQLRVIRDAEADLPLAELARRLVAHTAWQERTHRLEFVPDVWGLPLRSRTLPPATHTNAWMPGGESFVIVDPGSAEPAEVDRLLQVVQRRREEGAEPIAVLLTHHHGDHTAGARPVAQALDLPICAHAATLERLGPLDGVAGEPIAEGHVFRLGGLTGVVRHTPGHAAGHLALEVTERRALIAGDLVSGVSTIVIPPSDGDMGEYLESLDRVARGPWRWLFPGHGPPLPAERAQAAHDHRVSRHRQVLRALENIPLPAQVLGERAYADALNAPGELIEMQTEAHLRLLERERKAVRANGGWRKC